MQQYLQLIKEIKERGTHKNAAREGMPGTTSLFGYQFRHNLSDGFPLLTTKKMFWKGIVVELLWFLRGDTNIKYLLDNNVHIWDKDSYNYYCNHFKTYEEQIMWKIPFDEFIKQVNGTCKNHLTPIIHGYKWGDCGYQYGKVWRNWHIVNFDIDPKNNKNSYHIYIDQITNLIKELKSNPESRRHILTSIDPTHQDDLALYWCHVLSQFNCRPLTELERKNLWSKKMGREFKSEYSITTSNNLESWNEYFDSVMKADYIPKYYLDCQMYQRSADVILGVPFNIASYALFTHILCKICNMIPGEMIYSYGDVHIYDNHLKAVEEQLKREPKSLPILKLSEYANSLLPDACEGIITFDDVIRSFSEIDFQIKDYNPHPKLENEAELNTGI